MDRVIDRRCGISNALAWVEHQIDVRGGGARVVKEEPESGFSSAFDSRHVAAQKRCGRSSLLGIPRVAAPAKIAFVDLKSEALLEVVPKAGVLLPYDSLREAAIKDEESPGEEWYTVGVGMDDVFRKAPRAGKNRGEEGARQPKLDDLRVVKDEERVGSGRDAPLDVEKVPET